MTSFLAIFRVVRSSVATKPRVIGLLALGAVAILLGFLIGIADPSDPVQAGGDLINVYGLVVFVPVVALVFASAALGDMAEDSTLVYIWLRPVPRETIALAAVAAAASVIVPVVVVPLAIAAFLTGGGGALVVGTVVAASVCAFAYTGIFVALGLRIRRALSWGIAYLLIWEGFVARAGSGAARLSVQSYGRSILTDAADIELNLADVAPVAAVVVPVMVAMAGVALTTWFLHRRDVA
ncbi:MAG: hypothetical protein JJE52_14970 [Acidimicrobiia bacterium]|nr:hypothetical protein [Acidimicrobiia bacterium]